LTTGKDNNSENNVIHDQREEEDQLEEIKKDNIQAAKKQLSKEKVQKAYK
jgi:hypothetical protein